jgi:hypothetical protein
MEFFICKSCNRHIPEDSEECPWCANSFSRQPPRRSNVIKLEKRRRNFHKNWASILKKSQPSLLGFGTIYLVTLNSEIPISVKNDDLRHRENTIKVNFQNCKVGQTTNSEARKASYYKTFGEDNVNFNVIAFEVEKCKAVEASILKELDNHRIKGKTGRKNEWLENIGAREVERVINDHLFWSGVEYEIAF